MSRKVRSRGMLATAAIVALMASAFVASSQAQASTLYACVKKNGTARIYSKKPKCKKGESKLSWNTTGPAGKNGTNGTNGTNGINGTNGAVAGYFAQQAGIGLNGSFQALKGLEKKLPAGSFLVSVNVQLNGFANAGGAAMVQCELIATPTGGKATTVKGTWAGAFFNGEIGAGSIGLELATTNSVETALTVKCAQEIGTGTSEEEEAEGTLQAIQASSIS
jgi:hypothetical protein